VDGQTAASGSSNWRDPGRSGAGTIRPSLEEASIEFLGQEHQNTREQLTCSANARAITTTDEILDQLIRVIGQ
jgi:flagellar hook protein FlgE